MGETAKAGLGESHGVHDPRMETLHLKTLVTAAAVSDRYGDGASLDATGLGQETAR